MRKINTFSIVAYDKTTNSWGVAVASKFLACASAVSWASAAAGAIATQSLANLDYGDLGLKILRKGYSATKTLNALLALDDDSDMRQVGIVDLQGNAAAFTGKGCSNYAGHIIGNGFTCQGNLLVGKEVLTSMVDAYENASSLPFRHRLATALNAGDKAGGDRRGKQAAGLLVVTPNGSYGGYTDRAIDLRVDDNPQAVDKLLHLLELNDLYFEKPKPENIIPIEKETLSKLQEGLLKLGYLDKVTGIWDETSNKALNEFANTENFEERMLDGAKIDKVVFEFLLNLSK